MTTMLMDPFASRLDPGRRSMSESGAPRAFMSATDILTGERENARTYRQSELVERIELL